ncbi:hypothetical protein [Paraburkholderia eburnea]|uniref:hypothetical protein n=1 Tax=Paraburkholderia eburnea TaxID=1189126 RepID=UPI0011AFFDD5|nr:hypothetical protein [Paraburkholderia eburnea]
MSVKNNILEVTGSFVNEIRGFAHRHRPIKAQENKVFRANFPLLFDWKGIEIFVCENARDEDFMARHDVAALPLRRNAR